LKLKLFYGIPPPALPVVSEAKKIPALEKTARSPQKPGFTPFSKIIIP